MEIRRITRENGDDLNLKNEAFDMPGKLIPKLQDGAWSFQIENFEAVETMVFPDEFYDFEEVSSKGIAFGAYEDGTCIGIAIFRDQPLKYLYLYDLKVSAAARGKQVGRALIQAGMEAAGERGYLGLYTQAQDNNLNACLFYLKNGFQIGGFDNRGYRGTKQEGKADIIFYKE